MSVRAQIVRAGLDLPSLVGAEIGALNAPIVRRTDGEVLYVDYTDTASLRAKYAEDPNVDIEAIVDVDAIWGRNTLGEALGGRRMDYIIASHVAEHVPDLLSWLAEAGAALKPGGQLRLVLPDKRYSHDLLRPCTTFTDLVAAYAVKARRPQVRELVDFLLHNAPSLDNIALYEGRIAAADVPPLHTLEDIQGVVDQQRADPDAYVDVHCWVFTPRVFAELMQKAAVYGLLNLACASFVDTRKENGFEFFVFLRPSDDLDEIVSSWRAMATEACDPLPGSWEHDALQEREGLVLVEAETLERLRLAEAKLAAIESSTSWRATAPVRSLVGRFRGDREDGSFAPRA